MMKKGILGLLAVVLLFSGCAGNGEAETTGETTVVKETTPPGLYQQQSAIEKETEGAVRRYDLPGTEYAWLTAIGDKPLLAQKQGEGTLLTALAGEDGVPVSSVEIPVDLTAADACWQVIHSGFAYYDPQGKEVVFFDPQLQEQDRVKMPADMVGNPVIQQTGSQIFYCTQSEIRALETERRISRIIKSHDCAEQKLLGSYFDGELLGCWVKDMDDRINNLYISTENGQTAVADKNVLSLATYEDRYFAVWQDGVVKQVILGSRDGAPQQMNEQVQCIPAMELGGMLGLTAADGKFGLSFYATDTGKKTGAVTISGFDAPKSIFADRWSGCLWLLTADTETGESALLRWDPKASAVEDETIYTGKLYTKEAPDEEGLEACQDRVDKLNREHGVTIRIWEKATKSSNGHFLKPEHQVPVITKALDAVEETLKMFPKNFLYKSVNRTIRICIVRSVDSEVTSVRYWYESDPFIVIAAGADISTELLRGIGYVVDSHVLGNSTKYDQWDAQNPESFVYGDETTYSDAYLQGDQMAFLTKESMSGATEDRIEMFLQAIRPDNKDKFKSKAMQEKLLLMCRGIREAWRLQWKSESYLWEQYLNESLAY